jgi:hypothetical protein
MKTRALSPLLILALLLPIGGCANGKLVNPFSPTTNPDGTVKKNPMTLTQRTTQYREVFLGVETALDDLFEHGKISNNVMANIIGPAVLSIRQALKDMTAAATAQNVNSWNVYEKGFLGALDSLISQRRAAETAPPPATRPAFSPP